jgi:hypothetical protein
MTTADVQRLLARKPGPGLGERIVNGVVDGIGGVINLNKAAYKSLGNEIVLQLFPEQTQSFAQVAQDTGTGIVRWALTQGQSLLQACATAPLNSPESAMAAGFNSQVEQARQESLAAVPSMRFEMPSYIDGSVNGVGRSVENALDFGMNTWGAYGAANGVVSIASALRSESVYAINATGPQLTPARWNPRTPLIGSLDQEDAAGITATRLWSIMRRFFMKVADVIEPDSPATAEKLRRASPHAWRLSH